MVLEPSLGWGQTGLLGRLTLAVKASRKAQIGVGMTSFFVVLAFAAPLVARTSPTAAKYGLGLGPSPQHWLGTTAYGQDIFAQIVWGTRESLVITIVAGLAATIIAILVGVSAAYLGGLWDQVLSLVTDILLVLPALPLMIVIAAYLRGQGGVATLIGVVVLTSWSFGARQLRSQGLSLREREFIEAARVRGERSLYIIVCELLPNMTSLIVANFLSTALYSLLAAAGLQFIGLGDVNDVSWGTMLYWAENNDALNAGMPLWAIAPGACIALLGAALAMLNYAFDEINNPALRGVRGRRTRKGADG